MAEHPDPLTEADFFAAMEAAGLTPEDAQNMLDYWDVLFRSAGENEPIMEEALLARYRAAISGDISGDALDAALNAARDAARIQAETLTTNLLQTDIDALGAQVAQALDDGLGAEAMARRLETVQDLDEPRIKRLDKFVEDLRAAGNLSEEEIEARKERKRQQLLRERRLVIARTEAAHAVGESNRLTAESRGGEFKYWATSHDAKVSDDCRANEAQGLIPINDDFTSGTAREPQHPN